MTITMQISLVKVKETRINLLDSKNLPVFAPVGKTTLERTAIIAAKTTPMKTDKNGIKS